MSLAIGNTWGTEPLSNRRGVFLCRGTVATFSLAFKFILHTSACVSSQNQKILCILGSLRLPLMALTIFSAWSTLNAVFFIKVLTVSVCENTCVRSMRYVTIFDSILENTLKSYSPPDNFLETACLSGTWAFKSMGILSLFDMEERVD